MSSRHSAETAILEEDNALLSRHVAELETEILKLKKRNSGVAASKEKMDVVLSMLKRFHDLAISSASIGGAGTPSKIAKIRSMYGEIKALLSEK